MSFLYLSLAGEEKLACYRVDRETGDLEHLRNEPVPGAPSALDRRSPRRRLRPSKTLEEDLWGRIKAHFSR